MAVSHLGRLTLPIETKKLVIREFEPYDIPEVFAYSGDEKYYRFLPIEIPTYESVAGFIDGAIFDSRQEMFRDSYDLAIVPKDHGKVAGGISFRITSIEREEAEIGYALSPYFWGKGIVTEAALALIEAGFSKVGVYRIKATCDVENNASRKVMERCGMKQEGIMRGFMKVRGERRKATYLYAITREDLFSH